MKTPVQHKFEAFLSKIDADEHFPGPDLATARPDYLLVTMPNRGQYQV